MTHRQHNDDGDDRTRPWAGVAIIAAALTTGALLGVLIGTDCGQAPRPAEGDAS